MDLSSDDRPQPMMARTSQTPSRRRVRLAFAALGVGFCGLRLVGCVRSFRMSIASGLLCSSAILSGSLLFCSCGDVTSRPSELYDSGTGSLDAAFESFAGIVPEGGPTEGVLLSTAPCLTGGSVLWIDAAPRNDLYSGGMFRLAGSDVTWQVRLGADDAVSSDFVYIWAANSVPMPNGDYDSPFWVNLNTIGARIPFQVGVVYSGTDIDPDALISFRAPCEMASGSFRLDALSGVPETPTSATVIHDLTAAFSFTCQGASGPVAGCVHYASP